MVTEAKYGIFSSHKMRGSGMNLRTLRGKKETSEQHASVPYPHPVEFANLSSFAPPTTQ